MTAPAMTAPEANVDAMTTPEETGDAALRPIVDARAVSIELRDGTRLLDDVNVEIRAGELTVVVGRSGSGKTTLIEALAGVRLPTTGRVHVGEPSIPVGYVPQEDIAHRELTVEATVRYAARLRLAPGTPPTEVEIAVDRTLALLGLQDRRRVAVGSLSGGQRKRVSIATELVVRPSICFLDEPTAGLDPIAAGALVDALRSLVDEGTAVVMTTHNLVDLRVADRVIVVADGGRVAFDGAPDEGVEHLRTSLVTPGRRASSLDRESILVGERPCDRRRCDPPRRSTRRSAIEQTRILARRNVDVMLRNRMSLAIMAGSPLLVVAMFVVLFPTNAFDPSADRSTAIALVYWIAFAGFFFGLTFGLLQVCTEMPIVRRERLVAIDIGPYLLAKAAVLVPALGAADLVMIATLRGLHRLPELDVGDAVTVWGLLGLDALAGLALGLLASVSVGSAAQAALALPMLCFPAVLFSGAVLPVVSMTAVGRWIAAFTSDRWAFEAIARSLGIADGPAGSAARQAIDLHGRALSGPVGAHLLVMAALAILFSLMARVVLERRAR